MTQTQDGCRKLRFRFKIHPGDLFRDTSIQEMPDPYNDQEQFWVWFHPRFQSSQDIYELNNLYKLLHDEEFDEDFIEDNDWYDHYSSLDEKKLKSEIQKLETEITADCYENFYRLVRDELIEII